MLMSKGKKNQAAVAGGKGNRILVNITVIGSAGPIRLIVNEEELVAGVIHLALKSYAREGRLPVLSSDIDNFYLYCPAAGTEALSPWETIGKLGVRNFILCKKPDAVMPVENGKSGAAMVRKSSSSWKAWFNKSLALKIYSH